MTRIVRLSFQLSYREAFLDIFAKHKESIAGFEGFRSIELLEEIGHPGIFFTYSKWNSEDALEGYRNSEYFAEIWSTIKPWFLERAQAWSL